MVQLGTKMNQTGHSEIKRSKVNVTTSPNVVTKTILEPLNSLNQSGCVYSGSVIVSKLRSQTSVIFVNENENVEKRENNEFVNENGNEKMMKTKTKLKRKNRKRLKTKTKKSKTKMPK